MISIIIRGSRCSILGLPLDISKEMEELYSYPVIGHEYSDKFKDGDWLGKQYVYHDHSFTVGLLPSVLKFLKQKNIEFSIKDFRILGDKIDIGSNNKILREYQIKAVNIALENKMASFELATGAGKTFVIAEIIARLGYKTLVLVPSVEILKQMKGVLSEYLNIDIGVIGDKEYDIQHVTVATWQSLNSQTWDYQEFLNSLDILIVDEAQHIAAPTFRKIGKNISCIYRYGFSGTLFREDNADIEIEAAVGPKVMSLSYSDLISQGYLVQPKITILRFPRKSYPQWLTYDKIYNDYIVNNEFRNKTIVNEANNLIASGRKVLIFVTRIEHGEKLAQLAGQHFLYSTHPDRRYLIDAFRDGQLQCLISTSVLSEGFDLPVIDGLILAAPNKSSILTLQRIGRALRIHDGKKDAIIIDCADNVKYLWEGFQKRLNLYKKEPAFIIEKTIDTVKKEEGGWNVE